MASISKPPLKLHLSNTIPISFNLSPAILTFPFCRKTICAFKGARNGYNLLRKPLVQEVRKDMAGISDEEKDSHGNMGYGYEDERGIDWEDQILEDTVPLVGFVRMILHSGQYESGDRLSPEHENTILEKLLPFHPDFEKKTGCGIDYITIGYHPNFESSRCLFIARKDGELIDFSYWKCIKGLIRKNYPLYADSFILRHFRKRRHNLRS